MAIFLSAAAPRRLLLLFLLHTLIACESSSQNQPAPNPMCQDACASGATRCASGSAAEVCRPGPDGCLAWTQESCPAAQLCEDGACKPAVACEPACPSGLTCSSGVCTTTPSSELILDVKTVRVSGRITLNGATPTLGSSCTGNPSSTTATITFTDAVRKNSFAVTTRCSDPTFSFAETVYPGTYEVKVSGSSTFTNLPFPPLVVSPALSVSANTSNLMFDVKTITVAGRLTLNGATPTRGTYCTGNPNGQSATVSFGDTTRGIYFDLPIPCSDPTFSFSGSIYPGSYKVAFMNELSPGSSNIPLRGILAGPPLTVAANTSGLVLDIKTVNASGRITFNGAAPIRGASCAANPTNATAAVYFTDKTTGNQLTLFSRCNDATFSFSGLLFPGTYEVRVGGGGAPVSNIPVAAAANAFLAIPEQIITADVTNLILDVKAFSASGNVLLNGIPPARGPTCATSTTAVTAVVLLRDLARNYSTSLDLTCGNPSFAFSSTLYPGTYEVRVWNPIGESNSSIPKTNAATQGFLVNPAMDLSAAASNLSFDVQSVTLSGRVTVNGATPPPLSICSGSPTATTTTILLKEKIRGYEHSLKSLCADTTYGFMGPVFPGTYEVRVTGPMPPVVGNIPAANYIASSALPLSADTSGVVLDVKTVPLAGRITLNGAPPVRGTGCLTTPSISGAVAVFSDEAQGYTITLPSPCSSADFSFSGPVLPGTYRVTVQNPGTETLSNIPPSAYKGSYQALSQLRIP